MNKDINEYYMYKKMNKILYNNNIENNIFIELIIL